MKSICTIVMLLVLVTASQVFQPNGSIQAHAQELKNVQKPVMIFYSPHQDDEVLSMGMGIVNAIAQGYEVHLVLLTDGGFATGTLNDVNQKLYSETGSTISMDDFIKARTEEFLQSAAALGVKRENIHMMNFHDGHLTYDQARQTILAFESQYPHAIHCTMSYMDWHTDHAIAGKALNDLYNEHKIRDARFYVKNVMFDSIPGSTLVPNQNAVNLAIIQNAIDVYKLWAPEEQRYSIGYISVPSNFNALEKDPESRVHLANTPSTVCKSPRRLDWQSTYMCN